MGRFDRRQLLALLLISLGVLWLLVATGFVPPRVTGALLRFWPLLVIGLGLDLLLRRRPAGVPWVALAAAVILLLALVTPGGGAAEVRTFVEPLAPGGVERAEVTLDLGGAPTLVAPLEDDEALLRAEVRDPGRVEFTRRGSGGEPRLTLRGRGVRLGPGAAFGESRWDVGLSPLVPLSLEVDGGSGAARLDLRGLRIEDVEYDGGSGAATLLLPGGGSGGSPYEVEVDGGSGGIRIEVGDGAALSLEADGGSGPVSVTVGRDVAGTLTLSGGSGPLAVDVPDDAPVRLEVRDDGSGRLELPPFLERVSGDDERGVWQTAGFREGGGVTVVLRDAGSGPFALR